MVSEGGLRLILKGTSQFLQVNSLNTLGNRIISPQTGVPIQEVAFRELGPVPEDWVKEYGHYVNVSSTRYGEILEPWKLARLHPVNGKNQFWWTPYLHFEPTETDVEWLEAPKGLPREKIEKVFPAGTRVIACIGSCHYVTQVFLYDEWKKSGGGDASWEGTRSQ